MSRPKYASDALPHTSEQMFQTNEWSAACPGGTREVLGLVTPFHCIVIPAISGSDLGLA